MTSLSIVLKVLVTALLSALAACFSNARQKAANKKKRVVLSLSFTPFTLFTLSALSSAAMAELTKDAGAGGAVQGHGKLQYFFGNVPEGQRKALWVDDEALYSITEHRHALAMTRLLAAFSPPVQAQPGPQSQPQAQSRSQPDPQAQSISQPQSQPQAQSQPQSQPSSQHQAQQPHHPLQPQPQVSHPARTVVDGTACVGGNVFSLQQAYTTVAVELDAGRFELLRRNMATLGVPAVVCGDRHSEKRQDTPMCDTAAKGAQSSEPGEAAPAKEGAEACSGAPQGGGSEAEAAPTVHLLRADIKAEIELGAAAAVSGELGRAEARAATLPPVDEHGHIAWPVAALVVDPPWGGVEYGKAAEMELFLSDTPLPTLVKLAGQTTAVVMCKVPHNYATSHFVREMQACQQAALVLRAVLRKFDVLVVVFATMGLQQGAWPERCAPRLPTDAELTGLDLPFLSEMAVWRRSDADRDREQATPQELVAGGLRRLRLAKPPHLTYNGGAGGARGRGYGRAYPRGGNGTSSGNYGHYSQYAPNGQGRRPAEHLDRGDQPAAKMRKPMP